MDFLEQIRELKQVFALRVELNTIMKNIIQFRINNAELFTDESSKLSHSLSTLLESLILANILNQNISHIILCDKANLTTKSSIGLNHPDGIKLFQSALNYENIKTNNILSLDYLFKKGIILLNVIPCSVMIGKNREDYVEYIILLQKLVYEFILTILAKDNNANTKICLFTDISQNVIFSPLLSMKNVVKIHFIDDVDYLLCANSQFTLCKPFSLMDPDHKIEWGNISKNIIINGENIYVDLQCVLMNVKAFKSKHFVVYTDGACKGNGKNNAICSWAYYVLTPTLENNKRYSECGLLNDATEEFLNKNCANTNNRGELYAIYRALRYIFDYYNNAKITEQKVAIIVTDSKYSMNSIVTDYYKWFENGTIAGKANLDLIMECVMVKEKIEIDLDIKLHFYHYHSHTAKPNHNNILETILWNGNTEADRLATSILNK